MTIHTKAPRTDMEVSKIEEMVEQLIEEADEMFWADEEYTREDILKHILTKAYQAGTDEAVEKIEKEIESKLETWAALEHSRWSRWQAYLHSKLYEIDDNRVSANNHLKILPTELWQRWERQIMTPYADLSEPEKESDREQVRPYIKDLKQTIKALTSKK